VNVENLCPGLGQVQNCGGVKPVNGISTLPSVILEDLNVHMCVSHVHMCVNHVHMCVKAIKASVSMIFYLILKLLLQCGIFRFFIL
jgi:hypothetical protein